MNDRAIMKDVTIDELFKTVDLNGSKLLKRLSKKNLTTNSLLLKV